jgi:hypothetical protein
VAHARTQALDPAGAPEAPTEGARRLVRSSGDWGMVSDGRERPADGARPADAGRPRRPCSNRHRRDICDDLFVTMFVTIWASVQAVKWKQSSKRQGANTASAHRATRQRLGLALPTAAAPTPKLLPLASRMLLAAAPTPCPARPRVRGPSGPPLPLPGPSIEARPRALDSARRSDAKLKGRGAVGTGSAAAAAAGAGRARDDEGLRQQGEWTAWRGCLGVEQRCGRASQGCRCSQQAMRELFAEESGATTE